MPFIELISFVATDFLHESDMSGDNSPLSLLCASEGCLDVVQGRQIENSNQVYFITTWQTYDLYDSATREGGYASFMAYLMHYAIADPCVHHFEVDGDPHQALAAPVTEIVILRSKSGDWGWDQELCSGIKGATRGVNMVEGSYPPLRWGEVRDVGDSGSYCMFVGWDSVQAHFRAVREKPLQQHVKKFRQTTSLIDAKHVIFKSLRRTKERQYLPERMAGFRIHSSL